MICSQCPRKCNIDRDNQIGFCGVNYKFKVARAAPHFWEEPCISGTKGSGTVFFSGCNLRCVFCQNNEISHAYFGKDISDIQLMRIFDNLIEKGVHNLNLVTPSHYAEQLSKVLYEYKSPVPVVYNTSSYESVETLKKLEGLVDIYLPDIKYFDSSVSLKYSKAADYFEVASKAVSEMYRQCGDIIIDENGVARKGIIIRHLALPGNLSQTEKVFTWVIENLSSKTYISVMSQYTPYGEAVNLKPINRPLSSREYAIIKNKILSLGFENCFFQSRKSSDEKFIPDFNLEGVDL